MTVAPDLPITTYLPAGTSTGPFNTVFPYAADTDVSVFLTTDDVALRLTLNVDYTLADGAPNSLTSGGAVTLSAGQVPAGGWAGAMLCLVRIGATGQPSALGEAVGFLPSNYEAALDFIARQLQDLNTVVSRALLAPPGGSNFNAQGFRLRGLADAVNPADAATLAQVEALIAAAPDVNAAGPVGLVASLAVLRALAAAAAFNAVCVTAHTTTGDLGGGVFVHDPADNASADNGGTIVVDLAGRRWKRIVSGQVSVTWWGTGTADDGPAFNSALAASASVYVPPGTYHIATPITLAAGKFLNGAGRAATILSGAVANAPVVQWTTGQDTLGLNNLTVTHAALATPGGNGITHTGSCDHVLVHDVLFIANYHGCYLGTVGLGRFDRCEFSANVLDGFHAETQNAPGGALQWYLTNCIAAQNGQDGYSFSSTAGQVGAGVSCGTLTACNTYANGRYGMAFLGTATFAINGVRVVGGFLGNDGADGIRLDTYGTYNYVAPEDVELSGGAGIYVSANTKTVTLRPGVLSQNGNEGIFSAAPQLTDITGGQIISNGAANIATRQAGIFIASTTGVCAISGVVSTNLNGTVSQKFGIAGATLIDLAIAGCNLTGNATGAVTGITAGSKIAGCLPAGANQ